MRYPKPFESLITHFSSLPSIGPKMAERLVLYLFKQDEEKLLAFAESLEGLKHLSSCQDCFYISESELCAFCSDASRDRTTICVVEEPLDVIAIERTGSFCGLYHVLGGVLDSGKDDETLRVAELKQRIQKSGVKEVILATNPTTEGDMTAYFVKSKLADTGAVITRIARGLATGGDIEYADELTLSSSLENRKSLK